MALWLQRPNAEDSAISLFEKYRLGQCHSPLIGLQAPLTLTSVDSEGRKTREKTFHLFRERVSTGGN